LCVDLIIWCVFSGCEERTDHQQRFKQVIVVRVAVQILAPSSTTTCRAWIYIAHGTLDARVCRSSVVEFKTKKRFVCGTPAKDNSESRLWVIELCWSVRPRFRRDRVTGLGPDWLVLCISTNSEMGRPRSSKSSAVSLLFPPHLLWSLWSRGCWSGGLTRDYSCRHL
jgi:hypothetical protein